PTFQFDSSLRPKKNFCDSWLDVSAAQTCSADARMKTTCTERGLSLFVIPLLQRLPQLEQRVEAPAFVFGDPAFADLMDGRRIEVVQLLAASPRREHEVGASQNRQMLRHSTAAHAPAFARHAQRLAVAPEQRVEQGAAVLVSQSPENAVDRLGFGGHAIL